MDTLQGSMVPATESGGPPAAFQEAFEVFYLREFPKLVAVAAAVGRSRAVAEDLAQEAMIRAHRNWDRISRYDKPGAWARRVVINLSITAAHRAVAQTRRALGIALPASLPAPEPGDDDIWKEVRRLPRNQRAAVALHYLEDRSVPEIAEIIGCAEPTARVHLHRGRRALAVALSDKEPT